MRHCSICPHSCLHQPVHDTSTPAMSLVPITNQGRGAAVVVSAIVGFLALIVVILRLWARRLKRVRVDSSDWTCILGLVSTLHYKQHLADWRRHLHLDFLLHSSMVNFAHAPTTMCPLLTREDLVHALGRNADTLTSNQMRIFRQVRSISLCRYLLLTHAGRICWSTPVEYQYYVYPHIDSPLIQARLPTSEIRHIMLDGARSERCVHYCNIYRSIVDVPAHNLRMGSGSLRSSLWRLESILSVAWHLESVI